MSLPATRKPKTGESKIDAAKNKIVTAAVSWAAANPPSPEVETELKDEVKAFTDVIESKTDEEDDKAHEDLPPK